MRKSLNAAGLSGWWEFFRSSRRSSSEIVVSYRFPTWLNAANSSAPEWKEHVVQLDGTIVHEVRSGGPSPFVIQTDEGVHEVRFVSVAARSSDGVLADVQFQLSASETILVDVVPALWEFGKQKSDAVVAVRRRSLRRS